MVEEVIGLPISKLHRKMLQEAVVLKKDGMTFHQEAEEINEKYAVRGQDVSVAFNTVRKHFDNDLFECCSHALYK